MTPDRLQAGLDAIAISLSHHPQALALLALGSCGLERHRLDAYSDLDFFVIVEESAKQAFIDNLEWLTTGAPLVFAHRNTGDGWKTLDQDGVFCEFAVFYPSELVHIPFARGHVVWSREGFDQAQLLPMRHPDPIDLESAATEALTNILIGLKRFLRGEHLSARRSIDVDAGELVCRVLMAGYQADPYNPWRRMEVCAPAIAAQMQAILGQAMISDTARGLVSAMRQRVGVPDALCAEIDRHLELCGGS